MSKKIPLRKGETTKPIRGYKGLYSITSEGRIWSYGENGNSEGKFISFSKDKDDYLKVNLHKNGESRTFKVHRLVAQAFKPNPKKLPEVNHKDRNKNNCRKSNLEWCTPKQNSQHKFEKKGRMQKLNIIW